MLGGEDDMTWRDDLVVEAVQALVRQAVGAAAREEIDLPHIVVCRDPTTGAVSYSGPFPDGLTALAVAEQEAELDRRAGEGAPMWFGVAALLQPSARLPERDG